MPLLSSNQKCQECGKLGPCFMSLGDRIIVACRGCWDEAEYGPLPPEVQT